MKKILLIEMIILINQIKIFQIKQNKNKVNFSQKVSPNRNFEIRKMAEERATKRFKNLKEENLQPKKVI